MHMHSLDEIPVHLQVGFNETETTVYFLSHFVLKISTSCKRNPKFWGPLYLFTASQQKRIKCRKIHGEDEYLLIYQINNRFLAWYRFLSLKYDNIYPGDGMKSLSLGAICCREWSPLGQLMISMSPMGVLTTYVFVGPDWQTSFPFIWKTHLYH